MSSTTVMFHLLVKEFTMNQEMPKGNKGKGRGFKKGAFKEAADRHERLQRARARAESSAQLAMHCMTEFCALAHRRFDLIEAEMGARAEAAKLVADKAFTFGYKVLEAVNATEKRGEQREAEERKQAHELKKLDMEQEHELKKLEIELRLQLKKLEAAAEAKSPV